MIRKLLLLSTITLLTLNLFGATIDTLTTYSKEMRINIPAVVVKPDSYDANKSYPVVYLLHGHGGSAIDGWLNVPDVHKYSDQLDLIIVIPDGGYDSWYFDSPVNPSIRYETYIARDLVSHIDNTYSTVASPWGRAITGLSMGGHGALYLALRNQDVFGSAGSMSGGVDIRPFSNNWGIYNVLGDIKSHPENWEQNTVVNMIDRLKESSLRLIIDCGVDDFFYDVNVELHDRLISAKYLHDFISRPGAHTWEYWSNALKFQLLFFNDSLER